MSKGGSGMKGFDYCESAVEHALRRGAASAEAFFLKSRKLEAMIEKNDIHVPKGDTYSGIGLRVLVEAEGGFKQGFAATNLLESESIDSTISAAMAIAAASPADPARCIGDAPDESVSIVPVERIYDESIAQMGLDGALRNASALLDGTLSYDYRVTMDSASFSAQTGEKFILNSNGVRLHQRKTVASTMAMAFAVDGERVSSFDVEVAESCLLDDLDFFAAGRRLGERVVHSLDARPVPSFRGKLLITPYSAIDLVLEILECSCNADMVQSGRSKWKGMLGKQVLSPMMSLVDDPRIPGGSGSTTFDREGVISERVDLIVDGVLNDYLYNCYSASHDGRKSNGRASGGDSSLPGVSATNLIVQPGQLNFAQLLAACDRGLMVNRFSGNVDTSSGDFSGIVKGGYYIENGEMVHPIKEVMIAGNMYELLGQVVGLSDELNIVGNMRVPHILVDGCSITGK